MNRQRESFGTLIFALAGLVLMGLVAPGALQARTVVVGTNTDNAGVTLHSQSVTGVELRYAMTEFHMDPLEIDGRAYQKITLPRVFLPADAGSPDLPAIGRFIAMPQGATARLEILSSRTRTFRDVNVSPAPVIPKETDTGPLVYNINEEIYGQSLQFPTSPVLISEPGKMRGVDVLRVGLIPFQYNPVTKDLTVYTELIVRISFEGGNGIFGEDRLRSRYWEPILSNHILNYDSLGDIDFDLPRDNRNGCDYVIITADSPDFVAWADTLKNWRRLQGIDTEVFTTTDIGGTSAAAIESWLNEAYATWDPAPAAFLLLGDYPNSGFLEDAIASPIWSSYCVSDNMYADVDVDNLPEMVHARITARDAADLETMIGKMLRYERTPPTDFGFYDHPVFAGGWQTERWFILCSEICLGHQENVLGKNPVREYAIYSGSPGSVWSTNQNTHMLVDYFGPGGLGYIPSTPGHLTDWGANAARVNADINAGTYLLLHRDHGYEYGWGEPAYSNSDLAGLTNDLYPFVLSMNCLTGKYNITGECFTEAFHRMSYGALGLIAASEISYSFVNDTYVFGLFDTMWPEFMPDYGPFEPSNQFATDLRPAFGMVSGKYFLESSSWPYNTGDKTVTYHLFHHHGDAFMTLNSEVPQALSVVHDDVLFLGLDEFNVQADAGAFIALTVDGEIIGTAEATGLPQDILITVQTDPGTVIVTVTKANAIRYEEHVPVIPPDGPYLTFESCTVLDGEGDADGLLDAGEDAALEITLENVGLDPTTNVSATLSSSDDFVEIVTSGSGYPDFPPGGFGTCYDPYEIRVSGAAPDGYSLPFVLGVTSDEGQWEDDFRLTVEAPLLVSGRVYVDDTEFGDGNGVAEPSESVMVELSIANIGHSATDVLTGTLSCWNMWVTIEDAAATCDPIDVGREDVMGTWRVYIGPGCPVPGPIDFNVVVESANGFRANLTFAIDVGAWFDNVERDRGWAFSAADDDASTGRWERAEPIGTEYNGSQVQPEYDHTADPAEVCFVTANGAVGGTAGGADVDGGKTTLLTPVFDLSNATTAVVSYWRWYTNDLGNNPGEDYWDVDVTSNGQDWVSLEHTNTSNAAWMEQAFDLLESTEMTSNVQLRFVASDVGVGGSLVEAAVDDFTLAATFGAPVSAPGADAVSAGLVSISPNPFNPRARIVFQTVSKSDVELLLYDVTGRMVRALVDGIVEPGRHTVAFDGRNDAGLPVASGIYFLRLRMPEVLQVRQVALLK